MATGSGKSQQRTVGYRLYRQKEGARITWWPDPRGPGNGEMYWGTVISHVGDTVTIIWDNDEEHFEVWPSKECRYRVDRGQMRFIPPPKERRLRIPDSQLLCKTCGKPRSENCDCPRRGSLKPEEWGRGNVSQGLTPSTAYDRVNDAIEGNTPDEKGAMMAKRKAAAVEPDPEQVELEELEAVEELIEEAEASGDFLTAKAAASLLGTDGRTLRKFLRKKHGTIGQGQRWEIDEANIEELKKEFGDWFKGGARTVEKKDKTKAPKAEAAAAMPAIDADDALEEMEEIDELDMDE